MQHYYSERDCLDFINRDLIYKNLTEESKKTVNEKIKEYVNAGIYSNRQIMYKVNNFFKLPARINSDNHAVLKSFKDSISGNSGKDLRDIRKELTRKYNVVVDYTYYGLINYHHVREVTTPINKRNEIPQNRNQLTTKKLGEVLDTLRKYEYEEREDGIYYIFKVNRQGPDGENVKSTLLVNEEDIKNIFKMYSRKGQNLTQQELLDYGIPAEIWNIIKGRLGLNKGSIPIPTATIERVREKDGEEAVEEMMEEIIFETIDNKDSRKFVETYDKILKQKGQKAIRLVSNAADFAEYVESKIKDYKPQKITYNPVINNDSSWLSVIISDIHIGKQNTREVVKRLLTIAEWVAKQPETQINLINAGDISECLVESGMHHGQVEGLDDMTTFNEISKEFGIEIDMDELDYTNNNDRVFKLMYFAHSVLREFIHRIAKSKKRINFIGIPGNHDRILTGHGQDKYRTGGSLVYALTRKDFKGNPNIKFWLPNDKTVSFIVYPNGEIVSRKEFMEGKAFGKPIMDAYAYILNHGDEGFTKRQPENILWKNGFQGIHNIIINGDKHQLKGQETKDCTWVQIPGLAGKNEYDTRGDWHSETGFGILRRSILVNSDERTVPVDVGFIRV